MLFLSRTTGIKDKPQLEKIHKLECYKKNQEFASSDLYCIFNPGPLSIPASLLNAPPWQNEIYLALPYVYLTKAETQTRKPVNRLPFPPSIRVEILGVNIQCCSFSKRKMGRLENVLLSIGKFKRNRKYSLIKTIAYHF